MTAPILLTTTTTDHVDVYRRTVEGAIDQVGRFVWAGGGDVAALLTLVADLDQQLGWTNGAVSATVSSGPDAVERANVLPLASGPGAATAVATPDPSPPSGQRTQSLVTDDEILAVIAAAPEPLTTSQIVNRALGRAHNAPVGGDTRKRIRARLDAMVRAGALERTVATGRGRAGWTAYTVRTTVQPSRATRTPPGDHRRRTRRGPAAVAARRDTVEALLMQQRDPLNTSDIAARLDMSLHEARKHLVALRDRGRVRVVGSVRPGQPTFWRVTETVVTHREAPEPAVNVPGPDNWPGLVPTTPVEASNVARSYLGTPLENEQPEGGGGEGGGE